MTEEEIREAKIRGSQIAFEENLSAILGKVKKVVFTGCDEDQQRFGRYTGDTSQLVIGKEYTLDYVIVHDWYTEYFLEGFEGSFNSVCFEEVKS